MTRASSRPADGRRRRPHRTRGGWTMRTLTCAQRSRLPSPCSPRRRERPARAGRRPIRSSAGTASSPRAAPSATSPFPGRGTTTVAGVRVRDGRVLRYATVRGLLGDPAGHVGRNDRRHLGQRPEARAGLDHEPPARAPHDLRRPPGRTRSRSSAGSSSPATGCSTRSRLTGRRSTPSSTPTSRTTAFAPSTRSAAACSRRRSSTSASPTRRCAARR